MTDGFTSADADEWTPTCDRPGCPTPAAGVSYCDSCADRTEVEKA